MIHLIASSSDTHSFVSGHHRPPRYMWTVALKPPRGSRVIPNSMSSAVVLIRLGCCGLRLRFAIRGFCLGHVSLKALLTNASGLRYHVAMAFLLIGDLMNSTPARSKARCIALGSCGRSVSAPVSKFATDDTSTTVREPRRAIGIHDAAMPETFNSSLDEARLRAADYRMRAEELRMRAASIEWDEARANILKVAETYDALAQTIEDIAERQTRPWTRGKSP